MLTLEPDKISRFPVDRPWTMYKRSTSSDDASSKRSWSIPSTTKMKSSGPVKREGNKIWKESSNDSTSAQSSSNKADPSSIFYLADSSFSANPSTIVHSAKSSFCPTLSSTISASIHEKEVTSAQSSSNKAPEQQTSKNVVSFADPSSIFYLADSSSSANPSTTIVHSAKSSFYKAPKSIHVRKEGNKIWTEERTLQHSSSLKVSAQSSAKVSNAKSANVIKERNIISAQPQHSLSLENLGRYAKIFSSSEPSSAKQTTVQIEEIVDLCSDSPPLPARAPTTFLPLANIVGEVNEGNGYQFSCSCSSSSTTCSSNLCSNKGTARTSASSTSFFPSSSSSSSSYSSSSSSSNSNSNSNSSSNSGSNNNRAPTKAYHDVAKPSTINNKSSTIDLCSDSPPPRAPTKFLLSANIVVEGLPTLRNIIVTESERNFIFPLLTGEDSGAILIEKFAIDMSITKLKGLAPTTWLNDEIINFYFEMLTEGCISNNKRIHSFSSFFFVKLLRKGEAVEGYLFSKVRRWTKHIDNSNLDIIFIPVNITNQHWTLVLIDILSKTIIYYDSFRREGPYADAALQVSTCNILFLLCNK